MRLIDADALKVDHIVGSTTTNTECYRYVSKKQIDEAPTVESVPVVHGHWAADMSGWWCSVCDRMWEYPTPYCPHCGAKMGCEQNE